MYMQREREVRGRLLAGISGGPRLEEAVEVQVCQEREVCQVLRQRLDVGPEPGLLLQGHLI